MKKLIGLSGVAGCGKSYVADIMFKNYQMEPIAFADPIKRIVKEMFAFTDHQLWGPSSERNKPDLRYWRLPVSRDVLIRKHRAWTDLWEANFAGVGMETGFLSPLPSLRDYLGLTSEELACFEEDGGYLTPRFACQQLGTEYGRKCYINVWIDYTLRVADDLLSHEERTLHHSATTGVFNDTSMADLQGVTISDVRFQNEMEAIKKFGGKVVRIVRPSKETTLKTSGKAHQSEKEQLLIPDSKFDFVLKNVDDQTQLHVAIEEMMKIIG